MFQLLKSKIYIAIILLGVTLLIGIFGYRFVADYSWIDAVYMTVITITTVGFGEVTPLTTEAKIFTIFLILSSVVIVGFALTVITEYIINQNSYSKLKTRQVQKKIHEMNDHIIVCGYGRNGKQAVEKLRAYNKPFVIIEKDEEVVTRYSSDKILFVKGNCNEDEMLIKAGIERASTLIVALPDDADNLFVVLSARQLNKGLKIISRATVDTTQKKLKLAGADNVIMPDRIGGDHMASLVVVPDLIEFLDNLAVVGEENSINVEEICFDNISPDGVSITIKDINLRHKTGCTIIGYKSADGKYLVNPDANMKLELGSKLIVLGRPEQIMKLNKTYDL